MYKTLIRTFYFCVNPFRRFYWFIVKPKTRGAKCLIEWEGQILLTRLGYAHKQWTTPGGGVKKHETFEQAVRREVFEEVGIKLDNVEKVGEYFTIREHKRDTVAVFYSKVSSNYFKIDGIEITEAQWFKRDNLPPDRVPRVDVLIHMLNKF